MLQLAPQTTRQKSQAYYIKNKENQKLNLKVDNNANQSQVQMILNKMSQRVKHPPTDREAYRQSKTQYAETSAPKLKVCLSDPNLTRINSQQSPKMISLAGQGKDCPSRISHEDVSQNAPSFFNSLVEIDLRRQALGQFKCLLQENQLKLDHLTQLNIQVETIEQSLTATIKTIQIVKEQVISELNKCQKLYQLNIRNILDSISKMSDDISYNELNIVESMQMKPFNNIMAIYTKRMQEHQTSIKQMLTHKQSVLQFSTYIQSFMLKLQTLAEPVDQLDPNTTVIGSNLHDITESPCFKNS